MVSEQLTVIAESEGSTNVCIYSPAEQGHTVAEGAVGHQQPFAVGVDQGQCPALPCCHIPIVTAVPDVACEASVQVGAGPLPAPVAGEAVAAQHCEQDVLNIQACPTCKKKEIWLDCRTHQQ